MIREGEIRIPAGCAIAAINHKKRHRFSGNDIIQSIGMMRERSNGLGGGFAAYGIYPEHKHDYAIHAFFDDTLSKKQTDAALAHTFTVIESGPIPIRPHPAITKAPILWRYFAKPKVSCLQQQALDADEFVFQTLNRVQADIPGACMISCGKNMGVFKAVGYPEDVGRFYKLDTILAHTWLAHGRFPTNTPGWWGGAHPFSLLDLSVVHNGELSSYDANRRYLEMFDYRCRMQTDTEVITYTFDLLLRRHRLDLYDIASVIAPRFWHELEKGPNTQRQRRLRVVYASLLCNGPFSIIVGFEGGMLALNDRLKLRSLHVARVGDYTYMASEESAIRSVCPKPDHIFSPAGGQPVIALQEGDQTE